jgi:cytochrome c553
MPPFFSFSNISLLIASLVLFSPVHAEISETLAKVVALTPDLEAGTKIYPLCAACHGENGFGQQQGEYPSIAGQHQRVILKQLLDIQSKKRINPTMYAFSDMETLGGLQGMADIAAYTASLPLNPSPVTGSGKQLQNGETLYLQQCISCHGELAQGNAKLFYPRLSNQHYPYLVRELRWIRDGIRKNSDPAMVQILQKFSNYDINAVADYLSRR